MRLGSVRVDHLGRDEFGGGSDEGGLLFRRQRQQVGSGERPRRLDPNGTNGITEQRSDC